MTWCVTCTLFSKGFANLSDDASGRPGVLNWGILVLERVMMGAFSMPRMEINAMK
jgi:hypothetical protein